MSFRSFALVSFLLLAGTWLGGLAILALVWPEGSRSGWHLGVGFAFLTSTAGWSVAGWGLTTEPARYPAFMAAGVLVKLIGLGISIGIVIALGLCDLQEFLLSYAAAFLIVFFGQLAFVARAASRIAERSKS